MAEIPTIDFSNLDDKQTSWEDAKCQVHKAIADHGFFLAKFEQSPLHLRKATFDKVREAFDLPTEIKQRNNFNKPTRGYIGQDPNNPLYESLGIDDALTRGNVESFTNLMWPEGNHNFSETVQCYTEKMSELDKKIRRMLLESLGLDKHIDDHMSSTEYSLRFHKYDGIDQGFDGEKIGLRSHQDQNLLTILQQNEVQALEVLTKDGQWITPQCSLDSFVVMIGQSFRAFTNGRLYAPHHRVVMRGTETRYSITLFCAPLQDCIIEAAEEMVDEEHPLQFKPFQYSHLRQFLFTEKGWKSDDVLKDFVGI